MRLVALGWAYTDSRDKDKAISPPRRSHATPPGTKVSVSGHGMERGGQQVSWAARAPPRI